ncbi:unnamed protein product [Hydatigera taeniaeformis]|uniref:MATH domain-containing protein n=1 Tax=Hydatigena taeniaeformis TaxID=6205 RepID=A0A0R3WP15_HYDTA|nr:unnamed protein product [Hydatigera taeniaeformis]
MNASLSTSPQLRLIRFAQLTAQNVQFTFLLPACLVRGFISEVDSATFEYGNHMWRLRMVRTSLHIGAYLELVIPSRVTEGASSEEDFSLWLDFIFTVINLNHFSDNQTFTEKQVLFNRENMSRGSGCLIEATVINERNFVHEDGCLLVELELANVEVSLSLPLSLSKENHFESSCFVYGGEIWKAEMTVDLKFRASFNLSCQSTDQTLGYLVSFELLVNSTLEVSPRLDLLVHQSGGHIDLPDDINAQIFSSWTESFHRGLIFICLKGIRLYRVGLFILPNDLTEERSFLKCAEDAGGSSWTVAFFVASECLHVCLTPQGAETSALQPNSVRVVGWSWCFRDDPLQHFGEVQQVYIRQREPISQQHYLQTDPYIPAEVIHRKDSLSSQAQKNMREADEEVKSECTDPIFLSGSNLKVSNFLCVCNSSPCKKLCLFWYHLKLALEVFSS